MTLWNIILLSYAARHSDVYKCINYKSPIGKKILYKEYPKFNKHLAVFRSDYLTRGQKAEFRFQYDHKTVMDRNNK